MEHLCFNLYNVNTFYIIYPYIACCYVVARIILWTINLPFKSTTFCQCNNFARPGIRVDVQCLMFINKLYPSQAWLTNTYKDSNTSSQCMQMNRHCSTLWHSFQPKWLHSSIVCANNIQLTLASFLDWLGEDRWIIHPGYSTVGSKANPLPNVSF